MARFETFLRAVSTRHRLIALFVFVGLLVGITLQEVVPQYQVERFGKRGGKWQDHPSFLVGDCPLYRATLLSLLNDGDLDIKNNLERRQYSASSNVAQGARGEWYPKHTILMPIAAMPFYVLWRDPGLVAFNVVQLSLLLMLIWHGTQRYASTALATALTLYYGFGTCLRASAYNFAPDLFSTLLAVGGVVALLSRRATLGGLLLGLAVWAKWTNLIFLPVAGLFVLSLRELQPLLRFGVGAALPLAGLLTLNHHMFGSPFITPYDRVLIREHGKYVVEASHRNFFNEPFWSGLWTQLTDAHLGLLVGCPAVLLAPLGAALLFRRVPLEASFITLATLAQIAVFAKYEQWSASSYGPRFLLTSVALSALLAAPVLQRLFSGYSADAAESGEALRDEQAYALSGAERRSVADVSR
jgi:hypothetical protein